MTAVFTGAGISGDEPTALPRGFGLRDAVLRTMHEAARDALGALVTDEQLEELCGADYKLEVVLGRLWGTVGPDALDCVLALRVDVPNEAHMLSALHLLRGGTHVTVNFDVGIEMAYDLISGAADLPPGTPREYLGALPLWRQAAPALRTVSSHDEFAAWEADGRPPALLKVHGGLTRDQDALADVVVVDIEELGQLTAERAAAVDGLGAAPALMITGYSGGDPDVYGPLLAAAARTAATWACLELPAGSVVPGDAHDHGIDLVLGRPRGLAATALRELLGAAPPWPSVPFPGDGFNDRFHRWEKDLRAAHPAGTIAEAWAWLLADLGKVDVAVAMFARLDARLRHAEILYNRARGDDREAAREMFRQVGAEAPDAATRLHCLLRLGDIARGRANRQARGVRVLGHLAESYLRAVQVLVATRGGRRHLEEGGDAYRLLQQTSLRLLEQMATVGPRAAWPALALCCRVAARWGDRAARLVRNGNRLSLIRQHRAMLRAVGALLRGTPAPSDVRADMRALRATYRAADDLPGAGNCTVTLAVLARAEGDRPAAHALLGEALTDYAAGRPDGRPLPSGEALVKVMTRLIDR
ncbi:hypothetical protein [Paractinoplanes atraurantiacus]|uniref:SIR2-like domain-containing protein n=1 Tax=Paractinoplanes atraurantiacus TaxID=1036182 RepID=A0A285JVF1_9ACTN|nr:hypothetical protein [Actinoplanes atraurantiacus]SNY64248.1 hypothetical protein SAMN05421748_12677 [Actinoplanes atraurantiacus]